MAGNNTKGHTMSDYTAKDFDQIRALTDDELEAARKANGKAWFAAQTAGRVWVAEIETEQRTILDEISSRRWR